MSSCSYFPENNETINEIEKSAALKIIQSKLEDVVLKNAPLLQLEQSQFSQVQAPPGSLYNPKSIAKQKIEFDTSENLLLIPGDYLIPVWTFCLKVNGKSP